MVKHVNKDAITIKELLKKGMRQCQIAKLLNLKRAKVNYWSKVEIKEVHHKKKKLKEEYLKFLKNPSILWWILWLQQDLKSKNIALKVFD